jgi:hypothetical protein
MALISEWSYFFLLLIKEITVLYKLLGTHSKKNPSAAAAAQRLIMPHI